MIYVDTSVLGAIFFREPGAALHLGELKAQRSGGLAISAWSMTEMASVGALKTRTGAIDTATRQKAMGNFQRFVSAQLKLSEVEPADFRTASVFIETAAALRAGDALHLAITRRMDARLCSLDARQLAAAEVLGIGVFPLLKV